MAKATRLAFGEALAEVGATNSRVVAFDADANEALGLKHFDEVLMRNGANLWHASAARAGTFAAR